VPVDPFSALVKWVEHGVTPDALLAAGGSAAPASGRTRPICPYPQTAIYNGSGSIDDAASFHCGGNLETRAVVCPDVLVKYKHEEHGALSFKGSGVNADLCHAKEADDDDREEGDDSIRRR
jgi:feruloyl esterase